MSGDVKAKFSLSLIEQSGERGIVIDCALCGRMIFLAESTAEMIAEIGPAIVHHYESVHGKHV